MGEPHLPIPGRTELAYMPEHKPEMISFFCQFAPVSGGMTPVIDMQEVLQQLPVGLVARFSTGIFTSLNLPKNPGPYLNPLRGKFETFPKTWPNIDANPDVVEDKIRKGSKDEIEIEWTDEWLQQFRAMPAVEEHRGNQVWTGYFPIFHPIGTVLQACFDLCFHNRSLRQFRVVLWLAICYVRGAVANLIKPVPGLGALTEGSAVPGPLSSRLRGGIGINAFDVFRILWAYNTLAVKWPWQAGQFVLLDNRRMGHFRTPYPPCERRILTAFGTRKNL